MPASSSEKPYGPRIWFSSEDSALKKPTYALKAANASQNVGLRESVLRLLRIETLGTDDDADGGVGGRPGTKNDGIAAMED